MTFAAWCLVAGGVMVVMALAGSVLRRLPLSAAMIYLALGGGLAAGGLLRLDPVADAGVLEHLTEVAVLLSLFTAGLKLRVPLADPRWRLPVRLASVSMVLTIAAVAGVGVFLLGLSVGAAVLLGAVLAPTDPVLASDVQVTEPGDRDRVRFGLTGEAGLNDGAAFPFVMLGLGLLGLHDLGAGWWKWWAVDVLWAVSVGLGVGFGLGAAVGKLVLHLRKVHREAVGLDNFLALGLIGLAYGAAHLLGGWGFLSVFAAGVALRWEERRQTGERRPEADGPGADVHPEKAPTHMAESVLGFNEQAEKVFEVVVVVVIGALLAVVPFTWAAVGLAAGLFVVARPAAVAAGLLGSGTAVVQRRLIGWFGVRGVGSVYYLSYATTHGLPEPLARQLGELVVWTVALSVVVHGVSVTPLMDWYAGRRPLIGSG